MNSPWCPSCGEDSLHMSPLVGNNRVVAVKCDRCNYSDEMNIRREPTMKVKRIATIRHPSDVEEILEPMMEDIAQKHGIPTDGRGNAIDEDMLPLYEGEDL